MSISLVPDPHLILSTAAQNLSHAVALCEWIDNALDAGATTITVTFGRQDRKPGWFVSVEDDGCGFSDFAATLGFGRSKRHRTTRSGTYGIGSKDAALWYGGGESKLVIKSVTGGQRHTATVDWARMMRDREWVIDDPETEDAPTERPGTRVLVTPILRDPPHGDQWNELCVRLGYIYTPALKAGKQIKLQRGTRSQPTILQPWQLPPLIANSKVDSQFDVNGKSVRVVAGIVEPGVENQRPGLTYFHSFRVIKQASNKGCGNASIARVCGVVQIDDRWTRSKNKDDIVNAEQLYEAVAKEIASVLARAEREGMELRHQALADSLAHRLNAALVSPDTKERRSRGSKVGTNPPKGTDRKVTRAAVEQAGATFASARAGALRVRWGAFDLAEHGPARVLGNEVELNENHDLLRRWRDAGNEDAIFMCVCAVLTHEETQLDGAGQRRFRFDGEGDFKRVLGAMMVASTEIDGRRVGQPRATSGDQPS